MLQTSLKRHQTPTQITTRRLLPPHNPKAPHERHKRKLLQRRLQGGRSRSSGTTNIQNTEAKRPHQPEYQVHTVRSARTTATPAAATSNTTCPTATAHLLLTRPSLTATAPVQAQGKADGGAKARRTPSTTARRSPHPQNPPSARSLTWLATSTP